MARAQRELLDALAAEFLGNYRFGRTIIAIDGLASSRKFANAFAKRLGKGTHAVFRASVDRFYKPRAQRLAFEVGSAESHYRDTFDYDVLRRVLIDPFRLGGSAGFVTAAFDAERDTPKVMKWKTGPADATLIIDGEFLNRRELRGLWNFSVWLDEGAAASTAQKLYFAEGDPRAVASAIVDNSDPEHPRRVFDDRC